jgi:hypothetical protein
MKFASKVLRQFRSGSHLQNCMLVLKKLALVEQRQFRFDNHQLSCMLVSNHYQSQTPLLGLI